MITGGETDVEKVRIGVIANAQMSFGRNVLRGALRYIQEGSPEARIDIITKETPLALKNLSRYDGFVLGTSEEDLSQLPEGKPVIRIDDNAVSRRLFATPMDNYAVGRLAADIMFDLGLVGYGFYDGLRGDNAQCDARSEKRYAGFCERLTALGVEDLENCVSQHRRAGYAALMEWVASIPKPAGVFAYNDLGCLELAEICWMQKLSIPEDIALVGVDNDRLLCALGQPWLTSIDTNAQELAYQDLLRLVEYLNHGRTSAPPGSPVPKAILRESTGHSSSPNQTVQVALKIIEDIDPSQPPSCEDIAARAGVSLRVLETLFHDELGCTVQHHIIARRINRVKFYLRTTKLAFERISDLLYQDSGNLRRQFIAAEGVSPSEYRQEFLRRDQPTAGVEVLEAPKRRDICILTTLNGEAALDTLHGAETYARKRPDLRISINQWAADQMSQLGFTDAEQYDGFIVVGRFKIPDELTGVRPLVSIGHQRIFENAWSLAVDDVEVGQLAAKHFLEKGYQHFAYCGYGSFAANDLTESIDRRSEERYQGYRETLLADGVDEANIQGSVLDTFEALEAWVLQLPTRTALFAFNDALSCVILDICKYNGIGVPQDLAILGVDDDVFLTHHSQPTLSSIDIRFERSGYLAMEAIEAILDQNDHDLGRLIKMSPRIVIERESTRGPASDDPALNRATRFIESHYSEHPTIEQIVSASGVSRRTLENRCRAVMRHSIADHLLLTRMNTAKDLLTRTGISIEEVSTRSGFKHTRHFCQVFKKNTGYTPLGYRNIRGV
ncbi:MAG: substrate-binding domain-containing protein [Verrucomicrobiota bacterium]